MFHVVDDNLIGGKNTAKIINLFNAKTRVFTSAIDYLEYVRSDDYQKPTAVFTDILMYKMDGYELMEEVLAIHPDQKFVVVSGRPDLNHPSKNKACFYLTKPFYIRDIEKIVYKVSKCHKGGPSPEIECASDCNCSEFYLNDWRCPQLENLKAHARKSAADARQDTVGLELED